MILFEELPSFEAFYPSYRHEIAAEYIQNKRRTFKDNAVYDQDTVDLTVHAFKDLCNKMFSNCIDFFVVDNGSFEWVTYENRDSVDGIRMRAIRAASDTQKSPCNDSMKMVILAEQYSSGSAETMYYQIGKSTVASAVRVIFSDNQKDTTYFRSLNDWQIMHSIASYDEILQLNTLLDNMGPRKLLS